MDPNGVGKYISDSLKTGKSKSEISGALRTSGWKEEDITLAFNQADSQFTVQSGVEFEGRFLGPVELLKISWKLYTDRFWTLMGIWLLPFMIFTAIGILFTVFRSAFLSSAGGILFTSLSILVFIWGIIFSPWQSMALIYAIIGAENKAGIKDSFINTRSKILSYWRMFILQGAILWGTCLLFFIPGLIFAVWTSFSYYILVAEDLRGMNILLKSREYVRGHWWGVVGRMLALGIFIFCGLIPVLIIRNVFTGIIDSKLLGTFNSLLNLILAPLTPLFLIYSYEIYRNLRELKGNVVFEPSISTRRWWTVFGILGILIAPLSLLATIILIGINPGRQMSLSRDTRRKADLSALKNTVEMYKIEKHQYPASLNELSPDYFQELPSDPQTHLAYKYQLSADGRNFLLCAIFEIGGEDCLQSDTIPGEIRDILPIPSQNLPASTSPLLSASPYPTVSPKPINHFQSAGEQIIETGITAHITSAEIEGNKMVVSMIYRNTSTYPQKVASLRVAMYSKSYGSPSTPSYTDIPLSPGQSRQFTLSFEIFSELPPYTFRYAKLEEAPAVVLGTYSP